MWGYKILTYYLPIGIYSAIFIGSWLAHFSFYFSKNEDKRTPVLVDGLYKWSAKLKNERPRYRDLQSDAWCADILFSPWPIRI